MKIVWLTPETPLPANNGHRVVNLNRIMYFASRGHEIHLISFIENNIDIAFSNDLAAKLGSLNLFPRPSTSPLFSPLIPSHVRKRWSIAAQSCFDGLLVKVLPDVIMIESTCMTPYVLRAKSLPVCVVLNMHNLDYRLFLRSSRVADNLIKRLTLLLTAGLSWRFENAIFSTPRFDLFTFLSSAEHMETMNSHPNINSMFVPLVVDDSVFCGNLPISHAGENRILFVGNLKYWSNAESLGWFLDYVWPLIKLQHPEATLTIAGNEADKKMRRIARYDNSVEVRANFTDVNEVYQGIDVVIAPIVSGAGVKVKIIEALAQGKTVVTTHYGVMGTTLRHDEHLLVSDVRDAATFAAHCIAGLTHGYRYLPMRRRGRDHVFNNHRTLAIMPAFEDLLSNIVGKNVKLSGDKDK